MEGSYQFIINFVYNLASPPYWDHPSCPTAQLYNKYWIWIKKDNVSTLFIYIYIYIYMDYYDIKTQNINFSYIFENVLN